MAEVVQSLFGVTPQSLMASRDAQLQEQAMAYARMSPLERAAMGTYLGASRLGSAIGGMLGGTDPELEKVKQRQGMLKTADMSTSVGFKELASKLLAIGDYAGAQEAMSKATALEKEEIANTKAQAETAKVLGETGAKEEALKGRKRLLMQRNPEWTEEEAAQVASDPELSKELLKNSARKTSFQKFNNKLYLVYEDTGEIVKEMGDAGKSLEESLGSGLAAVAGAIAKNQAAGMGSKAGQDIGEQAAKIEGKYGALDNLSDAMDILDRPEGIFAGLLGPEELAASKLTKGFYGSPEKIANTEEFFALLGEVVIPRLQDFGGNDSVEELKYLKRVYAGDERLEINSMRRILRNAERKIKRGIERLERQQGAITEGKPVPLDAGPSRATKATKRWNPVTRQLEEVK